MDKERFKVDEETQPLPGEMGRRDFIGKLLQFGAYSALAIPGLVVAGTAINRCTKYMSEISPEMAEAMEIEHPYHKGDWGLIRSTNEYIEGEYERRGIEPRHLEVEEIIKTRDNYGWIMALSTTSAVPGLMGLAHLFPQQEPLFGKFNFD